MTQRDRDHAAIDLSIALDLAVAAFLDGKGITEESARGAVLERALGYFVLRYALEVQKPGDDLHDALRRITDEIAARAAQLAKVRPVVDAIALCGAGAR